MKKKEITVGISTDSMKEAVGRCNLVLTINKKMREIEKMRDRAERLSNKGELILFSEQVNFEIIEAIVGGSMATKNNIIIDKIEIDCVLNSNDSDDYCDFFLHLNLYSGANDYSFLFAKNKNSRAGYLVQTKNKELIIRDGGYGLVKFSSAENFQKVIKLCDEYLAKFNSFLKGEKLIPHINAKIVSYD